MRKLFGSFLSTTALIFAAALPANIAVAQEISVGGKIGVNLAKTAVDDFDEEETRTGIVGGASLGIGLGPVFGLQIEALYAQKGVKAPDQDLTISLQTDYLEMPLLARIRIPVSGGNVRPTLSAGPAVAFELACTLEAESGGVEVEVGCRESGDGLDALNTASVDFGLLVGGGLDIDVGKTILSFEGRYTHGLVDILQDDASQLKNRAFTFLVGLSFRVR